MDIKTLIYSPIRTLDDRCQSFDQSQIYLEEYMTRHFSRLINKLPDINLFERGIVNALEEYFLLKSIFDKENNNELINSSLCTNAFQTTLEKEFPFFDEATLEKEFPSFNETTLVKEFPIFNDTEYIEGVNEINGSFQKINKSDQQPYILFLDFDRNYSASLLEVASLLKRMNIKLLRLRYPYSRPSPFQKSPLEEIIPNCIYIDTIVFACTEILNTIDYEKQNIEEYLIEIATDPNELLTKEILNHFLNARIYRYGKLLKSVVQKVTSEYHINLIITADDTWPDSRSFALYAECPIVKFQDGILVKHYSMRQNFCDLWCVWSIIEFNYLVNSGIMPNKLAIFHTRRLDSTITSFSKQCQNKTNFTIIYASRPDSRDVSLCEKIYILRDLCYIAEKYPKITIINKIHPNENVDHIEHILSIAPANFNVIPRHVQFENVIVNADLVLAGVSLTLYEAVLAGIPAARITYGPRPNIDLFPCDVFPVVDSLNILEKICSNPIELREKYLNKQQGYVQKVLGDETQSIIEILGRYF